jgi:hypothetical protein
MRQVVVRRTSELPSRVQQWHTGMVYHGCPAAPVISGFVERRGSFSTTVRQSGLTHANESSVCIRRKREQEEEGECLHHNDRILYRNSRCDAESAISHAGPRTREHEDGDRRDEYGGTEQHRHPRGVPHLVTASHARAPTTAASTNRSKVFTRSSLQWLEYAG